MWRFAIAGLRVRDHWEGEGNGFGSCSIIVMPANDVMKPLRERMPASIAPGHDDQWTDPRITEKEELMRLLKSTPSGDLKAYPVSPWVNVPAHDDEQCIEAAI